jgi:hypothetical protein
VIRGRRSIRESRCSAHRLSCSHDGDDLAAVKSRLDRHDQRFDNLEHRFDGLQRQVGSLRKDIPTIVGEVMRDVLRER